MQNEYQLMSQGVKVDSGGGMSAGCTGWLQRMWCSNISS